MVTCLMLLCFVTASLAYPSLFIHAPSTDPKFANAKQPKETPGCLDHPAEAYGTHLEPQPDADTAIDLSAQSSLPNSKAGALCLGKSYDIMVMFGGNSSRYSLLTTSAGLLQPSSAFYNDTACSGKRFIPAIMPKPSSFKTVLFIPCNTTAKTLALNLTSTEGSGKHFMKSSKTLPMDACGEVKCTEILPIYPPPPPTPSNASTPPKPKNAGIIMQGNTQVAMACLFLALSATAWRVAAW